MQRKLQAWVKTTDLLPQTEYLRIMAVTKIQTLNWKKRRGGFAQVLQCPTELPYRKSTKSDHWEDTSDYLTNISVHVGKAECVLTYFYCVPVAGQLNTDQHTELSFRTGILHLFLQFCIFILIWEVELKIIIMQLSHFPWLLNTTKEKLHYEYCIS